MRLRMIAKKTYNTNESRKQSQSHETFKPQKKFQSNTHNHVCGDNSGGDNSGDYNLKKITMDIIERT